MNADKPAEFQSCRDLTEVQTALGTLRTDLVGMMNDERVRASIFVLLEDVLQAGYDAARGVPMLGSALQEIGKREKRGILFVLRAYFNDPARLGLALGGLPGDDRTRVETWLRDWIFYGLAEGYRLGLNQVKQEPAPAPQAPPPETVEDIRARTGTVLAAPAGSLTPLDHARQFQDIVMRGEVRGAAEFMAQQPGMLSAWILGPVRVAIEDFIAPESSCPLSPEAIANDCLRQLDVMFTYPPDSAEYRDFRAAAGDALEQCLWSLIRHAEEV